MTLEQWMRKHRVSMLYVAMDEAVMRAKIHQIKNNESNRNQSVAPDDPGTGDLS